MQAFAVADPKFVDVHETGVKIKQISHALNHDVFAITVKRVDDLMDVNDSTGKVTEVGLKISQVVLTFDVDSSGAITCNHEPVPYGLSMIKVEADVITGIKKTALKTMTEGEIKSAFDKGLVSVKVSATGQQVNLPNGLTIQRIKIREQIIELNGKQVSDSEVVQQIIEVYPNGDVVKGTPAVMDNANLDHAHSRPKSHSHLKAMKSAALWFKHQSLVVQIASVVGLGALFGLVSIALFQLFALLFLSVGLITRGSAVHDNEKGCFIEKVDMNEKGVQMGESEFDTPLPGYQHNGYTAVEKSDY